MSGPQVSFILVKCKSLQNRVNRSRELLASQHTSKSERGKLQHTLTVFEGFAGPYPGSSELVIPKISTDCKKRSYRVSKSNEVKATTIGMMKKSG